MGSTGSGSFSDYSQGDSNNENTDGSSGEDRCRKAFSTSLDEVGRSEYFSNNNDVPPSGTAITIEFNKRIVVVDSNGTELGYLPTKYNYLKICMENGVEYEGSVQSSRDSPIPVIRVDIVPA